MEPSARPSAKRGPLDDIVGRPHKSIKPKPSHLQHDGQSISGDPTPALGLPAPEDQIRILENKFRLYATATKRAQEEEREAQDALKARCKKLEEMMELLTDKVSSIASHTSASGQKEGTPLRLTSTAARSAMQSQKVQAMPVLFGPASLQAGFWGNYGDTADESSSMQTIREIRRGLGHVMRRTFATSETSKEFLRHMAYLAEELSRQVTRTAQAMVEGKYAISQSSSRGSNATGSGPST